MRSYSFFDISNSVSGFGPYQGGTVVAFKMELNRLFILIHMIGQMQVITLIVICQAKLLKAEWLRGVRLISNS